MDISSSQYNSVSESGWTHYLVQSSLSESHFHKGEIVDYEGNEARMEEEGEEEEEEEDLSMVSDASSGPPHYHEEDDQRYCVDWYPSTSQHTKETEKKKKRVKEYGRNQHPSPLDDTASSPVFNSHEKKTSFSGNGAVEHAIDFSQCLSASRIKRKPKFQKHFSFFKRSLDGKQASEEPGDPSRK